MQKKREERKKDKVEWGARSIGRKGKGGKKK
jgi:hypothetical protein